MKALPFVVLLQTELTLPAYAGDPAATPPIPPLSDAAAAAALNAPIITGRKRVPLADFVYIVMRDYAAAWAALQQVATTWVPATDAEKQLKAAAVVTYDYLRSPHVANIDMDLTATRLAYGGLVTAGIFPQAMVDAINAMANVNTSRAAQMGLLRPVTAAQVRIARNSGGE